MSEIRAPRPEGPPDPESRGPAPGAGEQLARRAGSVSLGVVISRITGLLRIQTLAYLFPTALLDAFFAAYTFPSTLREMLAEGALSKAFVATFAAVDEKDGPEAAHRLFTRVFRALVPVALLVTVLGIVFAPELVDFVFSRGGFDQPLADGGRFGFGTARELTVWLTRLVFPFIFVVSLAALFLGGLHARGSFFWPAVAASFFNVTVAVFAVLGFAAAPDLGIHPMAGLAIGVPAGGLVQFLAQALWFRRGGYRPVSTGGVRATLRDAAFRRVCRLFAPAAAAAGTLQINVIISRHFASGGASWLTWFSMAYRLVQLPAALVGVALSHAALPSLTRAAGREDGDDFGSVLAHAGGLMVVLSLAAAAGLIGIAEPLVSLVYRRGEFTTADTVEVARMILLFAGGLPAFGATKLLTDAFFAHGSTRLPLLVAAVGTGMTWVVTRALVVTEGLEHLGLPLASVSVAWFSAGLLAALLAPRLGRDARGRARARAVFGEVLRSGLAAAPPALATGASAWLAVRFLAGRLGGGGWDDLVTTLAAIAFGVVVWGFTAQIFVRGHWIVIRDAAFSLRTRRRAAP